MAKETEKQNIKVEYDNELNALSFRDFGEYDLNFLMAICAKMRDLGEETQYFDYDSIMDLIQWDRSKTIDVFHKDLKRMSDKLLHISAAIDRDENRFTAFNLFIEFDGDKQKRQLIVRINPRFKHILNDISGGFTSFELREYVHLSGKYSKLLYQHLKQYRTSGWWQVSLEDVRRLLGIPESMPTRNIAAKILNPSIDVIRTCKGFSDIQCETQRGQRRGRQIEGYKFTWTPKGQIKGQNVMDIDSMDPDKVQKPKKGKAVKKPYVITEQRDTDYDAIVQQRTLDRMSKSKAKKMNERR